MSGFDYSEFKKFAKNYEKAGKLFEIWLMGFLQENANWLKGKVIKDTPVDTSNLRRNWKVTRVYKLSSGNIGFVIYNNADYASYVELGHATRNRNGWVEGYYMCTININDLEKRMPRRFEKEFITFMKGHGLV